MPVNVFSPKLEIQKILSSLKDILKSGWIGLGEKTKLFEDKVTEYLNVKYAVGMNSCTAALHLAVKSLNLHKGDYVITTPITFVSTNHVLLYENLIPIFSDTWKTTGVICEDCIKEAITKYSIKAIICTHLGGYSCEMDEINDIAKENNISVIEDCAHAFGAEYEDKKVGDTDNLCCWSFHAVKNLPVGEGGMITTNDEEKANYFKKMRWLGIDKSTYNRSDKGYSWDYNVEYIGYKYHMSDIAAAIGLIQLEKIDIDNARRKQIADFYMHELNCIKPQYKHNRKSSYHFIPMYFENRDEIYKRLIDNDIYPSMHYKRNDLYKMYRNYPKVHNCENADWYEKRELTLPIHLDITDNDLDRIKEIVK